MKADKSCKYCKGKRGVDYMKISRGGKYIVTCNNGAQELVATCLKE